MVVHRHNLREVIGRICRLLMSPSDLEASPLTERAAIVDGAVVTLAKVEARAEA
jgi:hypothetical protein